MQNPFKNHGSDDYPRRDGDETRWDARDQHRDERPTWSEGDGGRTADAYRDQGREHLHASPGRHDRQMSGAQGYGYAPRQRGDYGPDMATPNARDHAAQGGRGSYGQDQQPNYGQGGAFGQDRHNAWQVDRSHDTSGRDSGRDRERYEGGYAPGSQIWRGQDRDMDRGRSSHAHHDFEPDYLHWRDQQMSNLDRDYGEWRNERREKFSSDFDNWRKSRPQVKAENPIVGDVADGGVGDASDAKKS